MNTKTDKAATYTSGASIGFLAALLLLGVAFEKGLLFPEQSPLVQVRLVDKTTEVTKTKVVTKEAAEKVYRVSVLDNKGKVIKTYENIRQFEFRIIGATLTTEEGKVFDVDGGISVEQVK